MRGKFFTIIGIVLIFGYFIMESFKDPSDPTQVVMVGNDTLGRDWGAQADARDREIALQNGTLVEESGNQENSGPANHMENSNALISEKEDPYTRNKINTNNYSTVESGDGREVITSDNSQLQGNSSDNYNYLSRRQIERGESKMDEPTMITRE